MKKMIYKGFLIIAVALLLTSCITDDKIEADPHPLIEDVTSTLVDAAIDMTVEKIKNKMNEPKYVAAAVTEECTQNCAEKLKDGTITKVPVTLKQLRNADSGVFYIGDKNEEGKREEIEVKFLLIDSPDFESKQAYSIEAKERSGQLLKNAEEIFLTTDIGVKYDKYGMILCYVWADNISVQETLLSEGLVRIAYAPNMKYLAEYEAAESIAKEKGVGIWSNDTDK